MYEKIDAHSAIDNLFQGLLVEADISRSSSIGSQIYGIFYALLTLADPDTVEDIFSSELDEMGYWEEGE